MSTEQVNPPQTLTRVPKIQAAYYDHRLAVGDVAELSSDAGIEMPDTDDVVMVVVDLPVRSATRLGPSGDQSHGPVVRFEGAEHTFIGNSATLTFDSGPVTASAAPLSLPNGLSLTYGQILALAGDFYGLVDQPLSDDPSPPKRFVQAYDTLASSSAAVKEAARVRRAASQPVWDAWSPSAPPRPVCRSTSPAAMTRLPVSRSSQAA